MPAVAHIACLRSADIGSSERWRSAKSSCSTGTLFFFVVKNSSVTTAWSPVPRARISPDSVIAAFFLRFSLRSSRDLPLSSSSSLPDAAAAGGSLLAAGGRSDFVSGFASALGLSASSVLRRGCVSSLEGSSSSSPPGTTPSFTATCETARLACAGNWMTLLVASSRFSSFFSSGFTAGGATSTFLASTAATVSAGLLASAGARPPRDARSRGSSCSSWPCDPLDPGCCSWWPGRNRWPGWKRQAKQAKRQASGCWLSWSSMRGHPRRSRGMTLEGAGLAHAVAWSSGPRVGR
jgi:hypothetical protein